MGERKTEYTNRFEVAVAKNGFLNQSIDGLI